MQVSLSFVEVRDSRDSQRIGPYSAESVKQDLLFTKVKDLTSSFQKKQKPRLSSSDSEGSAVFDSDGSRESNTASYSSNATLTSEAELESFPSSEIQLNRVRKGGLFSWKRRRLSFGPGKRKGEPLTASAPRVYYFLISFFPCFTYKTIYHLVVKFSKINDSQEVWEEKWDLWAH